MSTSHSREIADLIADAEHQDHMANLEALKQARNEGAQVVVLILGAVFLGIVIGASALLWALS